MFVETFPSVYNDMLVGTKSLSMRCPLYIKISFSIICVLCLSFIIPSPNSYEEISYFRPPADAVSNRPALKDSQSFHFVVPATSENKQLCRLLMSSSTLGYPSPTFINWNSIDPGASEYAVHMAKVRGVLRYLVNQPPERDQDLALIIDGYDIWMQLRPEIMLQRYFSIIEASNQRLVRQFGKRSVKEMGLYNSVVFGADKICWPEDPGRAGCWAVPESPLPRYAFGPDTDLGRERHLNRPRWLNSGTILGPIADLREVFRATLHQIETYYTIDSDQMYFADVWGRQEYARRVAIHDAPLNETTKSLWVPHGWSGEGYNVELRLDTPDIDIRNKKFPDLHITLDYEAAIFQTMAFYYPYVTWIHYHKDARNPLTLPTDLVRARPPLQLSDLAQSNLTKSEIPDSWYDIALATNTASKQVPALLHFTPPKELREIHWSRMWYYAFARSLVRNARRSTASDVILKEKNGRVWRSYEPPGGRPDSAFSGGFADSGGWLDWRDMCGVHEGAVFENILEHGDAMPGSVSGWLRPAVGLTWARPEVTQPMVRRRGSTS